MRKGIWFLLLIICAGCNSDEADDDTTPTTAACSDEGLLEFFSTTEGDRAFIYEDGGLYFEQDGMCEYVAEYFDPRFLEENYINTAEGVFILADGQLFPTKNEYFEDFESYNEFADMFILSLQDTDLYWNSILAQSPAAPTVSEYNELQNCIFLGTCDFIDNRIELTDDPADPTNTVLKFTTVAPTPDMVTSKASIESTINYFDKGSEVWFQADYLIESGAPFSLVDFENNFFLEAPGPRIVLRDSKLEFENKFGEKLQFPGGSGSEITLGEWFTLKVHLKYSNETDGIIEVWKDGTQIISEMNINLPTANSIQNVLEIGISASSESTVMYLDNFRISETEF